MKHFENTIHYLQYYRSDKNLGLAINERISCLNIDFDDWIILTDMDACFLTPNAGKQLEHIALNAPKNTGLIGCMTNRVGERPFLLNGEFSNNWDMKHHIAKAIECEHDHYGELELTKDCIPGYFMMFKMSTYFNVEFHENTLESDRIFNRDVDKLGLNKYIAKGLYMFHLYRPGLQSINQARRMTKHLMK